MSCGSTAKPPRRATTSAIRRPATAVMLDTTIGIVVPIPSGVVRSTANRLPTDDWLGTMNTSLYVSSCPGSGCSIRIGGSCQVGRHSLGVGAAAYAPRMLDATPAAPPRGARPRMGRIVRHHVAAFGFHRPARRRRPRGDRRRPARATARPPNRTTRTRTPTSPTRVVEALPDRPVRRDRLLARRPHPVAYRDRRSRVASAGSCWPASAATCSSPTRR